MRGTIVGQASGVGRAGVAVVRLSGEGAVEIARDLSGRAGFSARRAEFCLVDTGRIRDEAVVIYFSAPASYTGEDVVEIHCHGNPLIVGEVIEFCINKGARLAEAGEFTKRAFLNGKSDLSAAEAVHDIISAQTQLQLNCAQNQRSGQLFSEINAIQQQIYDIIADLNAAIDYPEEDLEVATVTEAVARAGVLCGRLSKLASTYSQGKLIAEGVRVAIYGAPNVGKSSLLNALLGYNRAIVSEQAGTTRDTIEDKYVYKGMVFLITDTAGIRNTAENIEKLGIARANEAAQQCDIILSVADNSHPFTPLPSSPSPKPTIYVKNKSDLDISPNPSNNNFPNPANSSDEKTSSLGVSSEEYVNNITEDNNITEGNKIIKVSALAGTNIEELKEEIYLRTCEGVGEGFALTNLRHYEAVTEAAAYLSSAAKARNESPEIVSIDLFDAVNALGKITGLIGSDEVITKIFSKFCVGK